ncbi:hypothetical protein GCM10022415_14610 [Knoellia locipacati]|uniref:Heavy metal-binding domain-containing protein n=1 Tax=Knoellia locipacati TaxID=882824 RepID=A0A512SZM9_9MICO|nr:hypothetical protein [Knoellia locipacati]GEQ13412.1 hypothetical protein KLO01_14590 [Knoellia locipacati]
MSTRVRVAGFVAALVAVLGITLGAGRLVGPVGPFGPVDEVAGMAGHGEGTADATSGGHGEAGAGGARGAAGHAADLPGGLQTSQDGYSLRLDPDQYAAGPTGPLTFVVEGPDGRAVTAYDVEHEKELHLIVVRRDFGGYHHVHPTRAADGTWSVPLGLAPGAWRVLADFSPKGGSPMTLGADLFVPGSDVAAQSPRDDLRTATVDGYTVTLRGDLTPGSDSALTLSVSRGGAPVTDLDPYLGAYGHLVALRTGDLAYLHVHPEGHPGDGTTRPGPDVTFGAEVPTSGTYRLFLDFKHAGVVRTAAFTLTAGTPLQPWKEDALP